MNSRAGRRPLRSWPTERRWPRSHEPRPISRRVACAVGQRSRRARGAGLPKVLLAREAERDRDRLPEIYRRAVDDALARLGGDPRLGKPLKGRLRHLRSLRVGVYRVVYRFEVKTKVVIVETVRHRSEAYR